jgi:hypothetical protein
MMPEASGRACVRRLHLGAVGMALVAAMLAGGVSPSPSAAGTIGNANFHHGFNTPNYATDKFPGSPAPCTNPRFTDAFSTTAAVADNLAGDIDSDVIRLHCYWNEFETGVNQYSQAFINGIGARISEARSSSGNSHLKALVNLDLPGEALPWMQAAGYGLQHTGTGGAPRYYPSTAVGLEAYGRAAGKLLKALAIAGVAEFVETPNEPNLTNGPSEAIPAEKIGQLGANAITYAALEGLQLNNNSGPGIMVGAVSTGQTGSAFYQFPNPKDYFGTVQWWTDFSLEQWWKNVPGGPSYAVTLMGTWRPTFHSYPKNGANEETPCETIGGKLQDLQGDDTGAAAYNTVINQLIPSLETITRSKRWWITETGMTSYKTTNSSETKSQCEGRRAKGGSSYGKTQQSNFYGNFVYYLNYMMAHSGQWWPRFEGVAFFLAQDVDLGGRQFAGYGLHWPAGWPECGASYPCRKPAANTFEQYY